MSTAITQIGAGNAIQDYGAGSSQSPLIWPGRFLAPTVQVPALTGRFKKFTEKDRFYLPKTERALSGAATVFESDPLDSTFSCTPRALDYPIDSGLDPFQRTVLFSDGHSYAQEISQLEHSMIAIQLAKQVAGNGTDLTWDSSADPIAALDSQIKALILQAKCLSVAVLFGATAWEIFKGHQKVRDHCPGGPDFDSYPGLFFGRAEYHASTIFRDEKPEGISESIVYVLDSEVLIFARNPIASRRDASFMKTFRVATNSLEKEVWNSADGRTLNAAYDWAEVVEVTNTLGIKRLNITN